MSAKRPRRKYWILTTTHECPLCGRGSIYRERQYTKKPKDDSQRFKYEVFYDYCDAL